MGPSSIVKRDGSSVPFERDRITGAIVRAQQAVGSQEPELAEELTAVVVDYLTRTCDHREVNIEEVQDAVIYVLQESGNYDMATAYTRYRDARERDRRRRRLDHDEVAAPNLSIVGNDARRRQWQRGMMIAYLGERLEMTAKAADEVARAVERQLADTDVNELSSRLLLSLVDAALVHTGRASIAERRAALRIDRDRLRAILTAGHHDGRQSVIAAGHESLRQLSLAEEYPSEVLRLYCKGRLWIDGLEDPQRGYEFTASLDGSPNAWQIISEAFALASKASRSWRRVNLVMPPMVLGHLERGGEGLIRPLEELSHQARCYLYCDGRTPLLDDWPFESKRIGIATYAEDFLLLGRLQEMGLKHLSGPHLMQGGYRRRLAVKLALNAQGLEDQYSQMDLQAMALVSAARVRQRQLADNPELAGADIRYAIYGLPPTSPSNEYLERQVVQEGLRCGIALARTSHLTSEACEHLGRLFD